MADVREFSSACTGSEANRAEQIDHARIIAINAAHHPTLQNVEFLLREVSSETDRLELIRRQIP
jgi:hypothetical protein